MNNQDHNNHDEAQNISTLEEKRVTPRPQREIQAWEEIGKTNFQPGVSIALLVIFLFCILSVPLVQHVLPDWAYQQLSDQIQNDDAPTDQALYTATILQVSDGPEQNAVYNDFVMKILIQDIQPLGDNDKESTVTGKVVLNAMGMKNRTITPVASLKAGDQITFTLTDWDEVKDQYGGLKASSLNGDDLFDTPRMWSEYLRKTDQQRGPHATEFYEVWAGRGVDLPDHARSPILQGMSEAWSSKEHPGLLKRFLATNSQLAHRIELYEHKLDDTNLLTLLLQSHVQELFVRMGVGNEKAYVGKDGWLFFEPGIKMLVGPGFLDEQQLTRRARSGDGFSDPIQPDPRKAVIDFHQQLKKRGITLVLMPTPVKPSIHPEYLTGRLANHEEALHNPSYEAFINELKEAGVIVYEVDDLLKARVKAQDSPQYLKTDTHWRPEAMQAVSLDLATLLRSSFDHNTLDTDTFDYVTVPQSITEHGDIATMLKLPKSQAILKKESVDLQQVTLANQQDWQATPGAKIMLLGDSFTNIYSLEAMGWGKNAGFAQHLSYQLKAPLDLISLNDAGAYATREKLAQSLQQNPHLLNDTKVLIWQFAERELAVGDWKMIELPPVPSQPEKRELSPELPQVTSAEQALDLIKKISQQTKDSPAIATKEDWLFLSSELEHLALGKFWGDGIPDAPDSETTYHDPLESIVDLKNKLEERGIELILMPAPPRAVIYADKLLGELPKDEDGNPIRIDIHHQQFYEALRDKGVNVIDLTDLYLQARKDETKEGLLALKQDTHWSPRGVKLAANKLYELLENEEWVLDLEGDVSYELKAQKRNIKGDLVDRVQGLTKTDSLIMIQQISSKESEFKALENDPDSPILLLTDSHGLVFHSGGDMHTRGAGLSDHVSYNFGTNVDLMAQRGSGAAVRKQLAFRFINAPQDADMKRVVVYTFAARELSNWKSWKKVPLKMEK